MRLALCTELSQRRREIEGYRLRRPALLGCNLSLRHSTNEESGQQLRNYWTNACRHCVLKSRCTPTTQRRIKRWEHEDVLEAAQERLDRNPDAMRTRREVVEHPFGTIKMRMGATHFLCKTLPKVASEMALCVLGYNITRVINIVGIDRMLEAVKAKTGGVSAPSDEVQRHRWPTQTPGVTQSQNHRFRLV